MPRKSQQANVRATRAYHRATATLRDLHREEWEALRSQYLAEPHVQAVLPRGPARGRKPVVRTVRMATKEDVTEAANLIGAKELAALRRAGFVLMRKVQP
jgi:hypothetical protein